MIYRVYRDFRVHGDLRRGNGAFSLTQDPVDRGGSAAMLRQNRAQKRDAGEDKVT